jgi:hypothetical protein
MNAGTRMFPLFLYKGGDFMNIVKCIMYLKSKGYTYIYDNTFFDSKGRKITFDNFYELEKFVLTLMKKDDNIDTTKH